MPLGPGSHIGHYTVTTILGTGGMGAVYRATDNKLSREVAIKVLPETFATDPERRARFTREAQVLASLNHPQIAAIYGVEENALIMELAPGRTLAERLTQGALPFEEAAPIARQVAEALEYAHERGVVHRDLKPANVMITPEGDVKVLDFGLAKIADERTAAGDIANSPTLTMQATQAGVILGTVAYMAPEQARGHAVDRRADIWAFGVVLYEMLSGKRLIDESSVSDCLAAVLKGDLSIAALPAETPGRIRELIGRCLTRDPKQRLRDIGEARIVLQSPGEPDRAPAAIPCPRSRVSSILLAAAVLATALCAAAAGWFFGRAGGTSPEVARLSITLPFPLGANYDGRLLTISPDGRTIAFIGRGPSGDALYLRPLERNEFRMVVGSENGFNPVFSPDGNWIAFSVGQTIRKAPVAGGPSTIVATLEDQPVLNEWNADGVIRFEPGFTLGMAQLPAAGGPVKTLLRPDPSKGESSYLWSRLVPDTNDLFYTVNPDNAASFDDARIAVETMGKPGTRRLLATGSFPIYTATGHLLFFSGGSMFAAPYDPRSRGLTAAPVPVLEGIYSAVNTGAVQAEVSKNGTLVYPRARLQDRKTRLVAVDLRGGTTPLGDFLPMELSDLDLSRDGRRVAMRVAKANDDIHVFDISRGSITRFTYEPGDEQHPLWSPDGKRLVYLAQHGAVPHMFWKDADGNGAPQMIQDSRYSQRPSSFSPDGRYLAYAELNPQTLSDLWTVRLEPGSPPRPEPFLRTQFSEDLPAFSPDGHWIAFQSDESGRMEIYIARFPGATGKVQVSSDGGTEPIWAPSGKQLFFCNVKKIMVADFENAAEMQPSRPRVLFEIPFTIERPLTGRTIAVFPDGKQFLMVERLDPPEVRELVVVLNWFEELKRKLR